MHRLTIAFLVVTGALFLGNIVAPQVIFAAFPWLPAWLAQGTLVIGFLSVSILGLFFSAILLFPFLIYLVRHSTAAEHEFSGR